ncbi:MASE1 domain-containing protein [Devosia lucknowensis]|nr:MASE1 domain-containing protein [Devosia lucknowensis]
MLKAIFTAKPVRFVALVALWLAGYKLATMLDVFRPYSSLWFLPAGVTLSIFLAAPGWLKAAPFVANLLLVSPEFSQVFVDSNGGALTQALHAIRHCGIYGLVAILLPRLAEARWPAPTVKSTLTFVVLVVIAAALAAVSGVTLHVWAGNMSWQTAWSIVVQWAIGDAVAALVLPPILVPALRRLLGRDRAAPAAASGWPLHLLVVIAALAIGSQAGLLNPDLGSLWYLTLIPPIVAGVLSGFAGAAISVFFTSLATPVAAYLLAYGGEMIALSLLLTIGAAAALLIGAAVSEQREALAEVIAERAKLEDTVTARTAELADAHEFQRHLVRSLGHDLRQPLHTIAMLAEGMALRASFDEQALGQLRRIAGTMSGVLDGILNYARFDKAPAAPNRGVVGIERLFAQLEAVYAPIAAHRGVTLLVRSSDGLLVTDETLVLQALSNDLDNAIRLSQAGMTVTIRHDLRADGDALLVDDTIESELAAAPGAAGFGRGIVARICALLGAERIEGPGQHGLLLPLSLPRATPDGCADTSNS